MPPQFLSTDILRSESEDRATEKILFVDDEPAVVDAIKRAFHEKFTIH